MRSPAAFSGHGSHLALGSIVTVACASFALLAVFWGAQRSYTVSVTACLSNSQVGCRFGSQAYFFEDGGIPFDDKAQEWRLRAFNSACQPKQLLPALLNDSSSGGGGSSSSSSSSGGGGSVNPSVSSMRQLVIALYGDRCVPWSRAQLLGIVNTVMMLGSIDVRTAAVLSDCRRSVSPGIPAVVRPPTWYACSIDANMLGSICFQAGAKIRAEPGPEPDRMKRYVSTSWCSTPRFLLLHSWTNGAPLFTV